MLTVNEVSRLSGVSIRTLQYYDRIGLLKPAEYTAAGYRLYGDEELERLQQILLFRELEFPLKKIGEIVGRSDFDKKKALKQQIELLTIKKEHIEGLIAMARDLQTKGEIPVDFDAFDNGRFEEYAARAKAQWGDTEAYGEYVRKRSGRTDVRDSEVMKDFMNIFERFGGIKDLPPSSEEAGSLVIELREYITTHFYKCTDDILRGLGLMYAEDNEFTANIDKAGGEGTARFVNEAIRSYLGG